MSTTKRRPESPETNDNEHRRYLRVGAMTMLVAILPIVVSVVFLYRAGELVSLRSAATVQQQTGALLGLAGYQNFFRYKAELQRARSADVLVLGSSRMMQLREEFFRAGFVNAGGAMNSIEEGLRFLHQIPAVPRLIILGLDFWWFHPQWQDRNTDVLNDADTLTIARARQPIVWLLDRRLSVQRFASVVATGDRKNGFANFHNLGLLAIQTASGFRKDGSYHYGNHYFDLYDNLDVGFRITLQRLVSADRIFPRGASADAARLAGFREIVEWAHARGVKLVVLLPPFAPPVAAELARRTHEFGFNDRLKREVATALQPLGSDGEFYDFQAFSESDACEYVDGIHGGDVTAQRMLRHVVRANRRSAVEGVVDLQLLERTIPKFGSRTLSVLDPTQYSERERDFLQLGCRK